MPAAPHVQSPLTNATLHLWFRLAHWAKLCKANIGGRVGTEKHSCMQNLFDFKSFIYPILLSSCSFFQVTQVLLFLPTYFVLFSLPLNKICRAQLLIADILHDLCSYKYSQHGKTILIKKYKKTVGEYKTSDES
jgi:hypothetical protein